MSQTRKSIVVAGDVTADWLMYPVGATDFGQNWQLHSSFHASVLPGGAFLLADFIKASISAAGVAADVVSPQLPAGLARVSPHECIHSNVMLGAFPALRGKKAEVLRIQQLLGYIGPEEGFPEPPALTSSPEVADIIVLDDAGNGFRQSERSWPKALLAAQSSTIVVCKMSRPLAEGPLWRQFKSPLNENLVVVLSPGDLRRTQGVHISQSLSWERTAKDLVYQLQRSKSLRELQQCPYLVVMFGTDGAILYRGLEGARATLVFDPYCMEGGFAARTEGAMMGLTSLFTASLVAEVAKGGLAALVRGMKIGLLRSRTLLEAGYVRNPGGVSYPTEHIFSTSINEAVYASCPIERPSHLDASDPGFWRILDQKTVNTLNIVAEDIVTKGHSKGLRGVPVGVFGKLQTIDRAEIESYSAIRELILEFLSNPKPQRPLCFAVFGPPGSGKSFGVKQVVKSMNTDALQSVTFNISQFGDYSDLVAAFHIVRDMALAGKVPFVFFDEFDSACGDQTLGWLKYFLAPMQDGEFKERDAIHPIGKAIFVFAGGTRSSFDQFVQNIPDEDYGAGDPTVAERTFREAKGPDFVSRLRGFINVMGPNRQRKEGDDDDAFLIRRANVLRAMLSMDARASGLFKVTERLTIDENVLRAMLHVKKYKHGARSMAAIIDMSRLAGKDRFDLSALPPREQLDLHVDAGEFLFLADRERFQSLLRLRDLSDSNEESYRKNEDALVQAVAELVHDAYAKHCQRKRVASDSTDAFQGLAEEKRRSNIEAARDIPAQMRAINCGIRKIPAGKRPQIPDISDEEVRQLALMEHDRWCREQRIQGYTYGEKRDPILKTSPYLIPYDALPADIKRCDIAAVYAIPRILAEIGYEIYRMEEVEEFHDPYLIEKLARIIHRRYVQERTQEGQSQATNPSMVDFDQLPEDLKDANRDNATAIPKKLKRIGFSIRRLERGEEYTRIAFSADQIESMAIMEHARWNWQKVMQGWVYGPGSSDAQRKTTPYLVPWTHLPPQIQDYDRQNVRLIGDLLQEAGYQEFKI